MTYDRNSPWTEEREAELRRRWAAGESGGVIARGMQMTRNQVLGRVHRLGLEKRPTAVGRPDPEITPLPKNSRPVLPAAARPQIAGSSKAGLSIAERRERAHAEVARLNPRADEPLRIAATFASEAPVHQQPTGCRFVIGSGTAWRYCQAVQAPGLSYCAEHALRCYRRPTDPEEE